MADKIDKEDIRRFLENKSSYKEAEAIAKYLLEHEEEMEKYIPFEATHEPTGISLRDKETMLRSTKRKSGVIKMNTLRRWVAAAAILVCISTVGLLVMKNNRSGQDVAKVEEAASPLISVVNTTQGVMQFPLPDGSQVKLTAQSEIQYDSLHFVEDRKVLLAQGMAHFDVMKDTIHPFRVIADGVQTRAVGTDFWVEKRPESNEVIVRLMNGKVRLTSVEEQFAMDEVELMPGQICAIDKVTGRVKVFNAVAKQKTTDQRPESSNEEDNSKTVVWTNNEMQFSNAHLRSVLNKIEARYHVKILVDDKIIERSIFTGKILNSDSLDQIINSICEINGLTYQMDADTIRIQKIEQNK